MSRAFRMTPAGELIPFHPSSPIVEGEAVEAYLQRLGFNKNRLSYIGDLDMPCKLEWHERVDGEGHQYLAIWSDAQRCELIFVSDWPMLIKLQALFAPIIQTNLIEVRLQQIHGMIEDIWRR